MLSVPVPMKAYSIDLRQKVFDAYQNGEGSIRQLAKRFNVSASFVNDLIQRHRQAGTIAPKPHGGGAVAKLQASQLQILQTLLEEEHDATLETLANRLYERTQVQVGISTIHRAIVKLKLTRKKSPSRLLKPTQNEFNVCAVTTGN